MGDSIPAGPAPPADRLLSSEDRHWLHDKYERLAAEEGQLTSGRTAYYAAIGTVLITGLVVALADLYTSPNLLVIAVTFMAGLGILISVVWSVLLHRTNDAQNLWREAARRLEIAQPPIEGVWMAPITLRSGETMPIDLLRPFVAHDLRFGSSKPISWMDRVNPSQLTELLPVTFYSMWSVVLVVVWVWYFVLR